MTKLNPEHKKRIMELITAGQDFSEVRDTIKKEGIEFPGLAKRYYEWKKALEPDVSGATERTGLRKKEEEKSKPRAKWLPKNQKEADESALAILLNKGVCKLVPCKAKEKELEEWQKECKDINLGGAVVGTVMYLVPSIDLNNPILVLVTRLIVWLLAFKNRCTNFLDRFKKKEETAPKNASEVAAEFPAGTK